MTTEEETVQHTTMFPASQKSLSPPWPSGRRNSSTSWCPSELSARKVPSPPLPCPHGVFPSPVYRKSQLKCSPPVREYMESSSLHGLSYIAEEGRHWTERVLWVLLCLCGYFLTWRFIQPIWTKFQDSPTLTTIGSTNFPIWRVNFPGVTLCPANKVIEEKVWAVFKEPPWKAEIDEYGDIPLDKLFHLMTGFRNSGPKDWDSFSRFDGLIRRLGQGNLTKLMQQVMPNCKEFLLRCWWRGVEEPCEKLFKVRKTDEGFCCSFNTVRQSQNLDPSAVKLLLQQQQNHNQGIEDTFLSFIEGGYNLFEDIYYDEDEPTPNYPDYDEDYNLDNLKDIENENLVSSPDQLQAIVPPQTETRSLPINPKVTIRNTHRFNKSKPESNNLRRSNSASYLLGLTVLMDAQSDKYFASPENFVGFKVMAHNPVAFPEVSSKGTVIDAGKEAFLAVTSIHTESSAAVRKMSVQRRNCIFSDEKNVPHAEVTVFKTYSQENCFLECRAKTLLKKCGCLPYFYPRIDAVLRYHSDFVNISASCTLQGWKCLINSTEILEAIDPMGHGAEHLVEGGPMGGANCYCPPTCTNTQYEATHSFARFPNKASRVVKEMKHNPKSQLEDLSLLHVYFKDLTMIKYNKDELFSWQDLLAAFGGLIGLCTGFSLLSGAEIVYFFTLRWWLQLCRERKMEKMDISQTQQLA